MPTFNYQITIEIDPGHVSALNQKTSFDTLISMFEKSLNKLRMNTAGMSLRIIKFKREGEKEESWKEFRENLRENKMNYQSDLNVRVDISGASATEQGAEKIIGQISSTIKKMGMNGTSGKVAVKVIGKGPLRTGQEPDEKSAYESIKRQGQG